MLAQLYEQLGKVADAEAAAPIMEAIQRIWRLSGSDTVDLLMARAERFTKEDDLDLAQKILDAAVDMAPDQAEAWYLRAKIHFLKKDYDAAIADLKRALDRDPKHYDAMNDLGVVYEAMGSKKEALEAYRKALAVNPYLSEPKRAVEDLSPRDRRPGHLVRQSASRNPRSHRRRRPCAACWWRRACRAARRPR